MDFSEQDGAGEAGQPAKVIYLDPSMLATVRIYDTEMTLSLPLRLSIVSGMNGLAHAFSAIYNPASNRYHLMVASEAVRCMCSALRDLHALAPGEDPVEARTALLYAAWLCGTCIDGIGIQHKMAHILGGTFQADHAHSHTVSLPHSIGYNEAAAPAERNRAASVALGGTAEDSPSALMYALQRSLDAPTSLRDIGLPAEFGEADLPGLMVEIMEGGGVSPCALRGVFRDPGSCGGDRHVSWPSANCEAVRGSGSGCRRSRAVVNVHYWREHCEGYCSGRWLFKLIFKMMS